MTTDLSPQPGPGSITPGGQRQHLEIVILSQIINNYGTHPQASAQLHPNMFADPGHRAIFEAFMDMIIQGRQPDMLTIQQHMTEQGTFHTVGMKHYLDIVDAASGNATHFSTHTRQLTEIYVRSQIFTMGTLAMDLAETAGSTWKHLDQIQNHVTSLKQLQEPPTTKDPNTAFSEMISGQRPPRKPSTDIQQLEEVSRGTTNGELCIIAGRPGAGKSTLINNLIKTHTDRNEHLLIWSLEMESVHVMARYTAAQTNIPYNRIETGQLSATEIDKITNIQQQITNTHSFEQRTAVTALDVRAAAIRANSENPQHPIRAIILDHGGLLNYTNPDNRNSVEEIGNISKALKHTAMELGITVYLLWQLNRQSANNKARPGLTDLRGSGRLEEDADQVIFIHRPELYGLEEVYDINTNQNIDTTDLVEFIVGKNRNGPTGSAFGIFNKPTFQFRDRTLQDNLPF